MEILFQRAPLVKEKEVLVCIFAAGYSVAGAWIAIFLLISGCYRRSWASRRTGRLFRISAMYGQFESFKSSLSWPAFWAPII